MTGKGRKEENHTMVAKKQYSEKGDRDQVYLEGQPFNDVLPLTRPYLMSPGFLKIA